MSNTNVKVKPRGGTRTDTPILPIYDSHAAAASATGIPVAVLRAAKRAGCPAFRSNRVDLALFLRWWFARKDDGDSDAGIDWKRERDKVATLRDRIRLEADRREVLPRGEVQHGLASGVAVLFSGLDRIFAGEFPALCKGLDESGIKQRSLAAIEALKEEMRERLSAITPEVRKEEE